MGTIKDEVKMESFLGELVEQIDCNKKVIESLIRRIDDMEDSRERGY